MISDESREKVIFHAARKIDNPGERETYLSAACKDNDRLRERVESLLQASVRSGEFLEQRLFDAVETVHSSDDCFLGNWVGPYKLLERIGEGGFGVVYMAEQVEPIRRQVAVKVIKAGMDTKQVVARFEAERQALALMDHANIAKVIDAGITANGRPYFAMELVRGVSITEFCDDRNLSTDQRLQLFLKVCAAVQHAHQKGIIHRDLKPTNVLVYTDGDDPSAKVIDFGIAKATQGRLTDKTLFTNFRQFIGSPAYMSPEQAQMSGSDVDTRSDIYSLGVLLYELLTGRTPLDSNELSSAGYEEVCRRIREDDPLTPSQRISSLAGVELTTAARNRRLDPAQLSSTVRGDLDWIVMKAVEKDRARRYRTVDGLADDIRRYLKGEPVLAVPPSATYLATKFIRRHGRLISAITAIAVTLVVAVLVSMWMAVSATQARNQLKNEIVAKNVAIGKSRANEKEAIAAQAKLRKDNYFHGIARASREWLCDDLTQAEKSLAGCPVEHRDWEWHYLNRLFYANHRVIEDGFTGGLPDEGNWSYERIQISADGKHIIARLRHLVDGKRGYQLLFWDAHTGEQIAPLCPIENNPYSAALSADSKQIVIGYGSPGGIAVWDIESRKQVFRRRARVLWFAVFRGIQPEGRSNCFDGFRSSSRP